MACWHAWLAASLLACASCQFVPGERACSSLSLVVQVLHHRQPA